MSERVARRRAQTRERIFTEAMQLFVERGFDNVTVADITEAADIGKGTFFTHFPSKRDVFRYLGEQVADAMSSAVTEKPAGTARERLQRVLGAAATWLEAHPELIRQMFQARSINLTMDLGSTNQQRFRDLLASILTDAQQAGELRGDFLVDDAVNLVFGSYYTCCAAWVQDPGARSLRDRLDAMLDVVFQGLAAR